MPRDKLRDAAHNCIGDITLRKLLYQKFEYPRAEFAGALASLHCLLSGRVGTTVVQVRSLVDPFRQLLCLEQRVLDLMNFDGAFRSASGRKAETGLDRRVVS